MLFADISLLAAIGVWGLLRAGAARPLERGEVRRAEPVTP